MQYEKTNNNPLLKYLSKEQLTELAEVERKETYKNGEHIIRFGARDRDVFVIKKGAVGIWIESGGNEVEVAQTGEGNITGEVNFIIPVRRSASLRAINRITVLRYPYLEMIQLLKNQPEIAARIFAAINDSIAAKNLKTIRGLSEKIKSVPNK
ncbi:MAG: cyclic nucleotide-binding domain-containing protein [Candidatus Cloacimonetes bacterium]|nr:cyclic nucleotide-binding domain-containing protein [Candidatus Cloacimonadota bacterium]